MGGRVDPVLSSHAQKVFTCLLSPGWFAVIVPLEIYIVWMYTYINNICKHYLLSLILVDFWTALLGPALLQYTMGHNFDVWWGFGSLLVHAGSTSRSWWSTISDQQDAATCIPAVVDCELESMCQKKQIHLFWILLSRYDYVLDNSRFRVDSWFDTDDT